LSNSGCLPSRAGGSPDLLEKAINSFDDLVRRMPNDVDLLQFYGALLKSIRKEEQSLRLHDRMVELDPLNALSHFQKAETLRSFGQFAASRQSYLKSEELGMPVAGTLAALALDEGDVDALQKQLERPEEEWGIVRYYYQALEASKFYLEGDFVHVKSVIPALKEWADSGSCFDRYVVAMLDNDWAFAFESIAKGVAAQEYMPFEYSIGTVGYKTNYPDAFEHPSYFQMLRDIGLDQESLDKLVVRPLPF